MNVGTVGLFVKLVKAGVLEHKETQRLYEANRFTMK